MNPTIYYQVANLSDEEVKDQFIVRKKEFERVISEIRKDDMTGSIQHYIYIGWRGSGKSTLLRRIQAEIDTDNGLYSRVVVINLSEEQAGIYRLHDLWERVCQELRAKKGYEVDEVEWEQYGNDVTEYAKAAYMAMQKSLKQQKKKLVLLLDNIDRIFENIKINDTHLFRELLMNYKDVRIIGASTRLSEHHWKYDQPFYEFFQIIPLESLTIDEIKELLSFWSRFLKEPSLAEFAEKKPGRLNAVRILSDGMPRTMLNFLELLINKPGQQGYEYLRYIVDRATPVYQERLKMLSALQQKVVLELSFFWDAAKVKQLSQAARIESKTISALLNQLVDLKIVEKIKGRGKNMMYRLKERFFNFWLIMTQGGPKQKSQAKGLTIFLETWYDSIELKTLCLHFMSELAEEKVASDRAVLMTKALVHSKHISIDERDKLLDSITTLAEGQAKYGDIFPPKAKDIFARVFDLIKKEQLDDALKELKNVEQSSSAKFVFLSHIYEKKGNKKAAERAFLKALKVEDAFSLFAIASIHHKENRKQEAEKYYIKAIEKGHINALNNISVLLYSENRNKEKAYAYIVRYNSKVNNDLKAKAFEIIVSVWSGKLEKLEGAEEVLSEILESKDIKLLEPFILNLLFHHQKNLVWQWFKHEELGQSLQDQAKPFYYVTARFVNNEEAREDLRAMPPELEETVNSVYDFVITGQQYFYGQKTKV